MQIEWDHRGNDWTDRSFDVTDENGEIFDTFESQPSLDKLRRLEREIGERLNLWQAGFVCNECNSVINGRFAANPDGDLLCWACAEEAQGDTERQLRVNTDPTKAVISESKLHEKSLCDHVINVATGCRHGCKFCYVPTTPAVEGRQEMLEDQADVDHPQDDWGSYLLYRDDLPERLARKLDELDRENGWKHTDRGRGVVMLSSGTDCYQDRRAAQITRGCVQELIKHDIDVRILTRSPAVTRDIDVFKQAGDRIKVGSSIPSFDAELVRAIEPNTSPPRARWRALDELRKSGVPVYVSMSPTYPLTDKYEIDELLGHFRALGDDVVVFHEPINPRGKNFEMLKAAVEKIDRPELSKAFEQLQDKNKWVSYAVEQINLVQRRAKEMYPDLEIHSWPDRLLVENTSGELSERLQAMRTSASPESFGEEPADSAPPQSPLFDGYVERAELI